MQLTTIEWVSDEAFQSARASLINELADFPGLIGDAKILFLKNGHVKTYQAWDTTDHAKKWISHVEQYCPVSTEIRDAGDARLWLKHIVK